MKYTTLPGSDIKVSKLCLGTMTWGEQNSEKEGHQQLDLALEQGINFIDTAEMYPVPAGKDTQGSTEKIIGTWLKKTGNRDKIVLASKIAGPGRSMAHIRPNLGYNKNALQDAVEKSLLRLQTDYIDLYQLHWPERNTNYFGKRDYKHKDNEEWEDNFKEVLSHLGDLIKAGTIRKIGLSNETPYGVMRCLEEAKTGAPRIVTVQNPYSLLNRKDEVGLTEILHRQNLGLFPYSPLGMGTLSGKYLDETPANSRLTLFPQYRRYSSLQAVAATRRYFNTAKKYGLIPAQMALAFVQMQPFVTSTIIGATTTEQLAENIGSKDVVMAPEIVQEINEIHSEIPNPAP